MDKSLINPETNPSLSRRGVLAAIGAAVGVTVLNACGSPEQPKSSATQIRPESSAPNTVETPPKPSPETSSARPIESSSSTDSDGPSSDETTPQEQPSSPENSPSPKVSEKAPSDLSPEAMWKMTPEERLEAIKIDKSYLDHPEELARRYYEIRNAVLSCGSTPEEYLAHAKLGTTETYAEYMFRTYWPLIAWMDSRDVHEETEPLRTMVRNAAVTELVASYGEYFRNNGIKIEPFKSIFIIDSVTPTPNDTSSVEVRGRALDNIGPDAEKYIKQFLDRNVPSAGRGTDLVTRLHNIHYDETDNSVKAISSVEERATT